MYFFVRKLAFRHGRIVVSTLWSSNSVLSMHGHQPVPVAYIYLTLRGLRRSNVPFLS